MKEMGYSIHLIKNIRLKEMRYALGESDDN